MAHPRGKRIPLIPILLLVTGLLTALVGWMCFTVWRDSQQVFHDVTIELGSASVSIRDFLTPLGNPNRAQFVTDPSTVDLTKVGRTSLTLRHGTQKAVVNLIVEDTTAPRAEFLTEYTVSVTEGFPQAGALVVRTEDYSQVRAYYAQEPVIPDDYADTTVTVVVEDTSGNQTRGRCLFHFTGWLKESCTLELGAELTPELLLTNPNKDAALLKEADLKTVSGSLGTHTLTVIAGRSSAQCAVTVRDTTAPTLELRNVRRYPGEEIKTEDFVVSAEDISGAPVVIVVGELPDPYAEGQHTVTVEATDSSGNAARKEAILWISGNDVPPEIQGASEEMTVQVNSTPDFLTGVTAVDDLDGKCDVTVDTSALDMSKAGQYTITYYSTDNSGNTAVLQRTVIVK